MKRNPVGAAEGRRIVVVGGGFSGANLAVQLVRQAKTAVHVSIVEPRAHLGRGLAYSAVDNDHRVNGPMEAHAMDPAHPEELTQWCFENGVLESDPEAKVASGHLFLRRSVLGAYFSSQVALHADGASNGSTIRHVRDVAVDMERTALGFTVKTASHGDLPADMVVLATGNPIPTLRKPFTPEQALHPRIMANPLEPDGLDRIPAEAHVLVVGSGLTALDMLSTLLRRGHRGPLTVVSRRGLRPREQSPDILGPAARAAPTPFLDRLDAPIPAFIAREPARIRLWCKALRREIARAVRAGESWHGPFDAVRDVVWKLWPLLPLQEQQRFFRRLRIFYDVHRFRTPPMNDAMVRLAESEGRVRYLAASVASVVAEEPGAPVVVELDLAASGGGRQLHEFDHLINCTGLDSAASASGNPFLALMERKGMLCRHKTGVGYEVSEQCEAIDAMGAVRTNLRVIGPPTAGQFGDPLGAVYIAAQVRRVLPYVMAALDAPCAEHREGAGC